MNTAALTGYLDSLESHGIPGCECIVCRGGAPVFRYGCGYADAAKTRQLSAGNAGRTVYWLYSATKIITCTAVLRLSDEGLLRLDAPVSLYLPEFGRLWVKRGGQLRKVRNVLTIRHLLSMQSGLNYDRHAASIQKKLRETAGGATTREIVGALAEEPLDFEPGTHFQYSLSHDVLGAVVEAAAGRTFGDYLRKNILEPLGMRNTGFRMSPAQTAAHADQYVFHEDTMTAAPAAQSNAYMLAADYESGGAGLFSTAEDYSRFLNALCCGGVSPEGYRLLSAEMLAQMRTNQLGEASQKDFDLLGKPGYGYGLGVRTLIEKTCSGAKSPIGEFGWDGAAGAYALADTENRLCIFYVQQVLDCRYAFRVIHPTLRDLVYDALGIT